MSAREDNTVCGDAACGGNTYSSAACEDNSNNKNSPVYETKDNDMMSKMFDKMTAEDEDDDDDIEHKLKDTLTDKVLELQNRHVPAGHEKRTTADVKSQLADSIVRSYNDKCFEEIFNRMKDGENTNNTRRRTVLEGDDLECYNAGVPIVCIPHSVVYELTNVTNNGSTSEQDLVCIQTHRSTSVTQPVQQSSAQTNTQPVQQTNSSVEMPWWSFGHMYPFVDRKPNTNGSDSTKEQDVVPDEICRKYVSEYESMILQQSEKLYTAISEMKKLYDKYQKMTHVNFIKISIGEDYEQLLPVSVTTAINRLKNEFIENKFSDEQHQELKEQMQRCEYDIRNCITGIFSHVYERDAFVYRLSDRNQVLDKMRKNIDFRLMGRRHIAELEKDLPYKTEIDSDGVILMAGYRPSGFGCSAALDAWNNNLLRRSFQSDTTVSSTPNPPVSTTVSSTPNPPISTTVSSTPNPPISTTVSSTPNPPISTTTPINVQPNYYKELSGDEILANYYENAIYEEENEPLIFEELYD